MNPDERARSRGRWLAGGPLTLGAVVLCAALFACSADAPAPTPDPEPSPPSGDALREGFEQLSRLYEQALEAGETAPKDVARWTSEDLARIGDWEYRVERLEPGDAASQTKALNAWGAERWEAYWMERDGDGYTVFLKRSARSYLRHVPVGDLLRLLPGDGGSGS